MTFKSCYKGSDPYENYGTRLKKFWKLHNSMQERKKF